MVVTFESITTNEYIRGMKNDDWQRFECIGKSKFSESSLTWSLRLPWICAYLFFAVILCVSVAKKKAVRLPGVMYH